MVGVLPQYTEDVTTDEASMAGESLRLDQVRLVARGRASVGLSDVVGRLEESLALRETLIDARTPAYGVTTAFSDSSHRRISPAQAQALQSGLVRTLGCETGGYAPIDEARAAVFVRANCRARGHSGVRPVVIERLIDLLNADIAPAIREQGSVGVSGDLVPLSHIAAALQGQRHGFDRGVLRPRVAGAAVGGVGAPRTSARLARQRTCATCSPEGGRSEVERCDDPCVEADPCSGESSRDA